MTNEEKWFDYWCIKNFGQDWYMCFSDLKKKLLSGNQTYSDEYEQLAYFIKNKKILPSFNYIKDGSCDCRHFNFTSYADFLKVFNMFFEMPKITITVNILDKNENDIKALLNDDRIVRSKHYNSLNKIYSKKADDNVFRILCILAMIADENNAINPHFTYVFTNIKDAVEAKGGNWKEHVPEAKYAKVAVAKYRMSKDENDLDELIDLSYFNGNGEIEILRYKNPDDVMYINGKKIPLVWTKIKKFPCFDCGTFGEENEKYFIVHINLHSMVGDTEFRRACKSAGVLCALIAKGKGESGLVNVIGLDDAEFNLFDFKAGSYYVKEGFEKVKRVVHNTHNGNLTCIYEDARLFDALLIKSGLNSYDSYCYKRAVFLDNLSVGYEYMKDNFSEYMSQDPFDANRYRFIIPLLIYPRAVTKNEERTFSRLVKAERLMQLWICGGWRSGVYLNFLRFVIEPLPSEEKIIKDYVLEHFKLFPCITIKKSIKEIDAIDFDEYESIAKSDKESNKRKIYITKNGSNNNKRK